MKDINQVCELLNLTTKQIKNMIDPNRNHRAILDKLGCRVYSNKYLFSNEAIKYIAYQYMCKNDVCYKYVFKEESVSDKPVKKVITKKMFKQIRK